MDVGNSVSYDISYPSERSSFSASEQRAPSNDCTTGTTNDGNQQFDLSDVEIEFLDESQDDHGEQSDDCSTYGGNHSPSPVDDETQDPTFKAK